MTCPRQVLYYRPCIFFCILFDLVIPWKLAYAQIVQDLRIWAGKTLAHRGVRA